MDREEHLEWCKQRAYEYLDKGDTETAYASFITDMKTHPETANHIGLELGIRILVSGNMDNMRKFIKDFN